MNIQKIILVIVLSIITTGSAFAQKKIGIFVHGFNGSSDKWTEESRVPQAWKDDGIINDFVALNYKTEELATVASQTALLNKFKSAMDGLFDNPENNPNVTLANRANNEWIIIGHSLGGIVGRLLYPKLREAGYNIVAVTSIGGPSQGVAAVDVDTVLIKREINRIKTNFKKATDHEWPFLAFVLNWQHTFNQIGSLLGTSPGSSNREQLDLIPTYLDVARDSAVGYASRVLESGANNKIGLEGILIDQINSFPKNNINLHPQNYLSIIGAEKDKAPIRMIGHIFDDEETKNEVNNLKQLDDFDSDYLERNERHWNRVADRYAALCAWYSKSCRRSRDRAREKEGYWRVAQRELQNVGKTWSTIINSYRIESVTYREFVPYCGDSNGFGDGPGYSGPGGFFNIDGLIDVPCSTNPGGEYHYRTETVQIADKNDGVVNIHSVLWSKGDSFNGDHNQYFDDVPADGGYNHFELRNHKRAYTLPGQFAKGDLNPSMEEVSKWIDSGFRF
jgi:pimeloyl-ACP methyl ester carboxylesterase